MRSRIVLSLVFATFATASLHAQATRTWVSGVGDDVNPCSRTAPCKTFAGAISKTAAGGQIDVLDPGGFGAVTINKSLTIDGGPFGGGILASLTTGVNINGAATDKITLRHLPIFAKNDGVSGIRINTGGTINIEDCEIYGFTNGINYLSTTPGAFLNVVNTRIRNNSGLGMNIVPGAGGSVRVVVDGSQIYKNTSDGIFLSSNTNTLIRNTSIWGHAPNQGINILEAAGTTTEVIVENSSVFNNASGIFTSGTGSARVFVGRTTIAGNTTGITIGAGHIVNSFGDNHLDGNGAGNVFSANVGPK
jgi:hypothetical protein